jgi:hypothetical protein
MTARPKIVKLIDRYSQKKGLYPCPPTPRFDADYVTTFPAELISMNENFVKARTIFDRMMEESLAKHNPGGKVLFPSNSEPCSSSSSPRSLSRLLHATSSTPSRWAAKPNARTRRLRQRSVRMECRSLRPSATTSSPRVRLRPARPFGISYPGIRPSVRAGTR